MKFYLNAIAFFLFNLMAAQSVKSPSGGILADFKVDGFGKPYYTVSYKNKPVIIKSHMGFELKDRPALDSGFRIIRTETSSVNESWKPVMGEVAIIHDRHNELKIALEHEPSGIFIDIVFRVFDEGVGFRYEFPKQPKLNYFIIKAENTEFNLTGDHKTFWIPGDFDSQEYETLDCSAMVTQSPLRAISKSRTFLSRFFAIDGILAMFCECVKKIK